MSTMTASEYANGTLLVVDDEANILAALTRLFRRDGYRLLSATSGEAGLALLAENEVGVILSDQRMPDMTGVEFLRAARERCPDTVRVMLSGYTDLSSVTDSVNKVAIYKFLTKPWDDDALREIVRKAFHLYRVTRENTRLTTALKDVNASLTRLNQELEQRVADKTREAMRNLHILQASQEILAHLPMPILGIDPDGYLVMVNRSAESLLGVSTARLGELAGDILPAELCGAERGSAGAARLADGRTIDYWRYPLVSDEVELGTALVVHHLDGRALA
ncbi:MAG: response regulator [Thiobacillus sp.]|nr:response regulator [Thiobacillus sp.]